MNSKSGYEGSARHVLPGRSSEHLVRFDGVLQRVMTFLVLFLAVGEIWGAFFIRLEWSAHVGDARDMYHCRILTIFGDTVEIHGYKPLIGFHRYNRSMTVTIWNKLTNGPEKDATQVYP